MKKNRKIYWLFLAPSLLGVAVFYCVPFLYAAYYAVIDNIGSGQFVGLQNFIDVLQNELFRTAAKNTLIFMALTVPLGMALALLTALCVRAAGLCRIALEVRVSNIAAIALYEKHGFLKVGVRPRFYRTPTEDAYIMMRERRVEDVHTGN